LDQDWTRTEKILQSAHLWQILIQLCSVMHHVIKSYGIGVTSIDFSYLACFTVAILEEKSGGATAGPRKSRGANINVYLVR